jgi:HEAT repeat protein
VTIRALSVLAAILVGTLWHTPAAASIWPNESDWVEQGLASEDVGERREAASHLGALPRASAERLVDAALLDDDVEVRVSAAEALLRQGFAGHEQVAQSWLSERDARLRVLAIAMLSRSAASPELLQALARALGDPDVEVKVRAAEALGASHDPSAVLSLLGHVDESNLKVQLAVIAALLELRDPRAVVALVGKVQDGRAQVREAVARALAAFGGDRVASALGLLLRDADDGVRLAAVTSLGRVTGADGVDAIVHALNTDPSLDVRVAAVHALARTGEARAAKVLVELLDGARSEVAGEAKLALSGMGAAAAPELSACLSGQPSRARADACAYALARTGDESAATAITDAWRRRVCSADAALEALGALGDKRALPAVLESLDDGDPWVRRRAVEALFVLLDPEAPDGRAVEPLLAAARAAVDRPDELLLLVALLGRTGASRVASDLLPYARSPRVRLRLAAVRALGMVRAATAEPVLLEALDAPEPNIRREAALALRRAGTESVVGPLLQRLDGAAEQDAEWLALSLSGPLSRTRNDQLVALVERRLGRASGALRDALLEALSVGPHAAAALERASRGAGTRSRAKVAELLSGVREARPLALSLAADGGATRENALWSLGFIGTRQDLSLLADALGDADARAAANAAVSWGRLASSGSDPLPLCQALQAAHPAVRVGALTGLRLAGLGCQGNEQAALRDPSPFVRLAAAQLLVAHRDDPTVNRLLERCADEDRDVRVAAACRSLPSEPKAAGAALTAFVFGARGTEPAPGLPYALRFSDGTVRHGIADRRGAVHEARPPLGSVSLDVPLLDSVP